MSSAYIARSFVFTVLNCDQCIPKEDFLLDCSSQHPILVLLTAFLYEG